MMVDPPIDQLIKKVQEPRYALTVAVAKRTRELISSEAETQYVTNSGLKPISLACKELYDGKIKIVED